MNKKKKKNQNCFAKDYELTQGIGKLYQPKTIYKLVNDFKMHGREENKNKKASSRVTHIGPPLQVLSAHSWEKWHLFVKPPKDQFVDVVQNSVFPQNLSDDC